MESQADPVMCEVCGTYFETRRGLSSHARLHLRQLGVTLSETSGAPIELLYQVIQERDGSLPKFNADTPFPDSPLPLTLKKPPQQEPTSPLPQDKRPPFIAGTRVTATSQKLDQQGSPARSKESASLPLVYHSTPPVLRLGEGSSSSSLEPQTTPKPLWAPLDTDAPITLASGSNDDVHVCQLCGCWYETRKGLSSHARSHLRQIGIPDNELKGSPIEYLYQIMEEEELKPLSTMQPHCLFTHSPAKPSPKRPSEMSSPSTSPSKRQRPSEACTCALCGEEFENRKGLSSHARSHLRQIGVLDLLGKGSPIDTVQELISSGVLEATHPPRQNSTPSSPPAPSPGPVSPAAPSLSPAPGQSHALFPSTSSAPPKPSYTPGTRAPKAKKGFRLAVDPLHRKPKPEPLNIDVSAVNGSSTNCSSPSHSLNAAVVSPKPGSADDVLEAFAHTEESEPSQEEQSDLSSSEMLQCFSSTDGQSPPTVICDYCGQLFDTRKALSCHARAHLRQLGLTWSIRTSPIDLLKEVMMHNEEGGKAAGTSRPSTSGKTMWSPQGSKRTAESHQSADPGLPVDYTLKEKSTPVKSGPSPADKSCELCGFEFENRKALASHARAHLRQLGLVEWKAEGASSPIELLSELIKRDPTRVAAVTRRYRMGDLYIKKKAAASPSLSTDSESFPGGSSWKPPGKQSEHKMGKEDPGASRRSHSHAQSMTAYGSPGVGTPRGVHPQKKVMATGEENQDSSSQQATRSGSIPALLPRPPLTPLVKLVGKIYSLKCRFCEKVFEGPLSVQEQWIIHLQKHILSLGYKGKASPPATPAAAPALIDPVAV